MKSDDIRKAKWRLRPHGDAFMIPSVNSRVEVRGKRGFEQLLRWVRRRIPDSRAAHRSRANAPLGRIATKQSGLLQIDILSPCLARAHAVSTLNFLSSPGTRPHCVPCLVLDRSAVTRSRKESVKISAAGHAKACDLSSIVDPKRSEQM
jgi:hypothetical protein